MGVVIHVMVEGPLLDVSLFLESVHQVANPKLTTLQWDLTCFSENAIILGSRDSTNVFVIIDAPAVEALVFINGEIPMSRSSGAVKPSAPHIIWVNQKYHPMDPTNIVWLTHGNEDLQVVIINGGARHGRGEKSVSGRKYLYQSGG